MGTFQHNSHNSQLWLFILFYLQSNVFYIKIGNTMDHLTSKFVDLHLNSYQKHTRKSIIDLHPLLL